MYVCFNGVSCVLFQLIGFRFASIVRKYLPMQNVIVNPITLVEYETSTANNNNLGTQRAASRTRLTQRGGDSLLGEITHECMLGFAVEPMAPNTIVDQVPEQLSRRYHPKTPSQLSDTQMEASMQGIPMNLRC